MQGPPAPELLSVMRQTVRRRGKQPDTASPVFYDDDRCDGQMPLANFRFQLTLLIELIHTLQRDRLDFGSLPRSAESLVAGDTNVAHCLNGLCKVFARI